MASISDRAYKEWTLEFFVRIVEDGVNKGIQDLLDKVGSNLCCAVRLDSSHSGINLCGGHFTPAIGINEMELDAEIVGNNSSGNAGNAGDEQALVLISVVRDLFLVVVPGHGTAVVTVDDSLI